MALPGGELSPIPVNAAYKAPRDGVKPLLEAYERGGVALQNNNEGVNKYNWTARCDGTTVTVERDDIGTPIPIYTGVDITEIDLAFDQTMNPQLALVEGGVCRLHYYDTVVQAYQDLDIPFGSRPKVTLDDHRQSGSARNDVLFCYVLNNRLMMRVQRERFLIEHELAGGGAAGAVSTLEKIGMSVINRMQFDVTAG